MANRSTPGEANRSTPGGDGWLLTAPLAQQPTTGVSALSRMVRHQSGALQLSAQAEFFDCVLGAYQRTLEQVPA